MTSFKSSKYKFEPPKLEDWLIRPLKFKGLSHAWAFDYDIPTFLEEFIFTSKYPRNKPRALTFMGMEFSGVKFLPRKDTNIAFVVMNDRDKRLELHVNPYRIKKLAWEMCLERLLRAPSTYKKIDIVKEKLPKDFYKMKEDEQAAIKDKIKQDLNKDEKFWSLLPIIKDVNPKEYSFSTDDAAENFFRDIFDQVVLHEFGHLWFFHLKICKDFDPKLKPFFNIAVDGLVIRTKTY
jgi:hypothetical protein